MVKKGNFHFLQTSVISLSFLWLFRHMRVQSRFSNSLEHAPRFFLECTKLWRRQGGRFRKQRFIHCHGYCWPLRTKRMMNPLQGACIARTKSDRRSRIMCSRAHFRSPIADLLYASPCMIVWSRMFGLRQVHLCSSRTGVFCQGM